MSKSMRIFFSKSIDGTFGFNTRSINTFATPADFRWTIYIFNSVLNSWSFGKCWPLYRLFCAPGLFIGPDVIQSRVTFRSLPGTPVSPCLSLSLSLTHTHTHTHTHARARARAFRQAYTEKTSLPSKEMNTPHSTEYCRNLSEIFPILHCNWNIAARFLSIITKYFIARLQF